MKLKRQSIHTAFSFASIILYSCKVTGLSSVVSFPFSPSQVSLNGIEHYTRDTGDPFPDAPIAVLLHGLAGNTDSWEDVAPVLFEGGVRAIAIDRVGFGRTERPQRANFLPQPPQQLSLPPVPSFLRESLASAIESIPLPPPPGALRGILPTPNAILATAIRRPSLLSPKLPWKKSVYGEDPYSSEFAVSTLWPLLQEALKSSSSSLLSKQPRRIYLVGHSAGGPIALRAFNELMTGKGKELLPPGCDISGVILVAPAVLDPEEDPGAYDYREKNEQNSATSSNDNDSEPTTPAWLRRTIFQSVLSLPDAFGVPLARQIFDGRNITEALLNQTSAELSKDRAMYLADKYVSPVIEFPDEWDVGLLNVYRANFLDDGERNGEERKISSSGRELLRTVRKGAERVTVEQGREGEGLNSKDDQRPIFCVITGDDDRVVPARASRKVADLLGSRVTYVEIKDAGHLPMDERPEEFADVLLNFICSGI